MMKCLFVPKSPTKVFIFYSIFLIAFPLLVCYILISEKDTIIRCFSNIHFAPPLIRDRRILLKVSPVFERQKIEEEKFLILSTQAR